MMNDDDIMAILLVGIDCGDVSLVRDALALGADPDGVVARLPALHHAVQRMTGQVAADIVAALCAGGAQVDLAAEDTTPLTRALWREWTAQDGLPVVDALLAAGADISLRMPNGALPLLFAVAADIKQDADWRTRRLLAAGANPDALAVLRPEMPQAAVSIRMTVARDAVGEADDVTPRHRAAATRILDLLPPSPAEIMGGRLQDKSAHGRYKLRGRKP